MGNRGKLTRLVAASTINSWRAIALLPIQGALLLGLGACSMEAAVSGLKPLNPPQYFGGAGNPRLEFAEVKTLQPTLSWEPFPGRHQWPLSPHPEKFVTVDSDRVSNVTYDLIIWSVDNGNASDVVYEHQEIPETSHTLEEPLAPSSLYFWSVRTRFELEGKTRVSEWSLTMVPWYPGPSPRVRARNNGRIPSLNYYRFKTPSSEPLETPGPVVAAAAGTEEAEPESAVAHQVNPVSTLPAASSASLVSAGTRDQRFDGRYSGTANLERGSAYYGCSSKMKVSITVTGGRISGRARMGSGQLDLVGKIDAETGQVLMRANGRRGFDFEGKLASSAITGKLLADSPVDCVYGVELRGA